MVSGTVRLHQRDACAGPRRRRLGEPDRRGAGRPPSPRCSFGFKFAAAGGRLYVFVGLDESGACAGAARSPSRGFDEAHEQLHRWCWRQQHIHRCRAGGRRPSIQEGLQLQRLRIPVQAPTVSNLNLTRRARVSFAEAHQRRLYLSPGLRLPAVGELSLGARPVRVCGRRPASGRARLGPSNQDATLARRSPLAAALRLATGVTVTLCDLRPQNALYF